MFQASRVLEPAFQEQPRSFFWQGITANHAVDEALYLKELIPLAESDAAEHLAVTEMATDLIQSARARDDAIHMIDALLQEYSLDTQEGILLMCLAEALMRIPDRETADALIQDKLSIADWNKHVGRSESALVNASTWGLLLTGRVVRLDKDLDGSPGAIWKRLIKSSGETVIRKAMYRTMAIMGQQFVLGQDIDEALANARDYFQKGYTYSFDMLGESAITADVAERYLREYRRAIDAVSRCDSALALRALPSVSVKLSALHPRFETSQEQRVMTELYRSLSDLVLYARERNVGITLDAEEMDRLELSLRLFENVFQSDVARGWGQFGLVVQAYSKRALPVLCWLNRLAKDQGDRIPVRLVKGAYWDTEIKICQQRGLEAYPVFTRKEATDTSYLACLRFLLSGYTCGSLYPQVASHNALTVASAMVMAERQGRELEFQRLHGMGVALYNSVLEAGDVPVRIYAPVGAHKDLLPYLVRRLLENGANSSFVHRLVDARTPIEALVQNPVQGLFSYDSLVNDRLAAPADIYGPQRRNASGVNLNASVGREQLLEELRHWQNHSWSAAPLVNGESCSSDEVLPVYSPSESLRVVGHISGANAKHAQEALKVASSGVWAWTRLPVSERSGCLERFARLMEQNLPELVALCCYETGKTIPEGVDEVRSAVDHCRYYAVQARALFGDPIAMPGITGENNELYLEARGVFLCISPWHCPLAVFSGQVAAALVAGNSVLAKPAKQATLIAYRAVQLMLEAGIPANVIQLLPGDGSKLASVLIPDPRIAGIAFTGSNHVAREINRTLAGRPGPIVPFMAATGGKNAMIVDSSAVPEQVVKDVVRSAFTGAGQGCSALKVLYLQEDIGDQVEELLSGAIAQLSVGDPECLSTDVGPMIDGQAKENFQSSFGGLEGWGRLIARGNTPVAGKQGNFVAPVVYAIDSILEINGEVSGPVLHVIRYPAEGLQEVVDEINQTGFGLTLGIHSRSESMAAWIEQRVRAGNCYINRDQIGAVAGAQPFGGLGLSGTGPKAGGPHYLLRFCVERTRTVNTAAAGGNASLLSLGIERIKE